MVNGLPSGGQQTDMNHLWAVVQQLSQLLEENKAQTQGIINGVAAIQGRAAEEGGAVGGTTIGMREVNGEINSMYLLERPSRGNRQRKLTTCCSSGSRRRNRTASNPAFIRPTHHHRPHRNKHVPLHPPHRLRVRIDPAPRQIATVRLLADDVHSRPTQTLPKSTRRRAQHIHGPKTRARRMAGGTITSSRQCEKRVTDPRRSGRGIAQGVQRSQGRKQSAEAAGRVGREGG